MQSVSVYFHSFTAGAPAKAKGRVGQLRQHSLLETATNTSVGLLGSWAITYWAVATLPSRAEVAAAGVVGCAIWSFIRTYLIRRLFDRGNQSRQSSAIESCVSTVVGAAGNFAITWWMLAVLAAPVAATSAIVLACTAWSMARGYAIRRAFATLAAKQVKPSEGTAAVPT